ncbi:efflux pump membrane protein [Raoultella terrigena]|uniref:Efflux pump membrane protein n=1 Tax=Raoultella terrigena TaxID=577 RepID=A0A4U9D7F4_RAOTE|nr:efflux pump membrane protein [Raoultella terrigena]
MLLLVVPALGLAAGGWCYFANGHYVETDNAYVKADKTDISAEVAGSGGKGAGERKPARE